MSIGSLQVVAGVVERDGRVLVARRRSGPRGGLFEFPGGKVEPGETHAEALRRELLEELALDVVVAEAVCTVCHRYPDLDIALHAYRCHIDPAGAEPSAGPDHDELRWAAPAELAAVALADADREIAARVTEKNSWRNQ